MITVTLTSQVKAERGQKISPSEMREWLAGIPENASIDGMFEERGDQRDYYKVFVGLKATWTEQR